MNELPLKAGVCKVKQVHRESEEPARPAVLSQNESWAELLRDHVLFTPALLYLTVPLVDPFAQYQQDTGRTIEVRQLVVESRVPLFSGLVLPTDDRWNMQVLYGLRSEVEDLHKWLVTVKYSNAASGMMWQPLLQDIRIRDDSTTDRLIVGQQLPETIPAVGWAVATTRGSFGFKELDPTDRRMVVAADFDPQAIPPALQKFRDNWLKGQSDAYNVRGDLNE